MKVKHLANVIINNSADISSIFPNYLFDTSQPAVSVLKNALCVKVGQKTETNIMKDNVSSGILLKRLF
jgi:hypothetical protein